MRHLTASLLVVAAACGGGGSKNNPPDANHPVDASPSPDSTPVDAAIPACVPSAATFGTQDFVGGSSGTASTGIVWGAPITQDLGDGGAANVQFEFYPMIEDLSMPHDLSAGVDNNYATCGACVRVVSTDSTGAVARQYFQSGGTIALTEDPFTAGNMKGTITNLSLVEVSIDSSTFMSTLVPGGKCLSVGSVTLNHNPVPNAYTCAVPTYNDGASCNCMCGAHDPDCDNGTLPVAGCMTGQVCSDTDTCVAAPTCTIDPTFTGPTLAGQTAKHDSAADETVLDGALNADTLPDGFELQLWNTFGVFANGVVPGTYTITGDETKLATCGACALLLGDIDASSGTPTPKQGYMATAGTLTLTSTTTTLTGTLTNATFAAFKQDAMGNQVPDGSNCTVAIDTVSFSAPITAALKKTGRIHIGNVSKVHGVQQLTTQKAARPAVVAPRAKR